MEFGETIKKLRKKEGLTQEQFAMKINVTRQAVSNWENNRNLPDLEMLLRMAALFHLSLDEFILGESQGNNLTEKLIKDGSEKKRAQFNLITTLIGTFLLLVGLGCFFIKANSVEYVDATGLLHENFYLLPIGFLFILAGTIIFLGIGIRFVFYYWKNSFKKNE
jgi:transcriptional regulator with XRE-family HTH domain